MNFTETQKINKIMAIPAGLEPATPCLEGRCSIRLSYAPASGSNIITLAYFVSSPK